MPTMNDPEHRTAVGSPLQSQLDVLSGEELIMDLERDQFVVETSRPVALAPLGARASAGLWALRVFVVLVSLMVIYTFIYQLS
jgi:hypothetical protein